MRDRSPTPGPHGVDTKVNVRPQPNDPKERSQYICMYHLKGCCAFGERCFNVHSHLPYQWFFRAEHDTKWTPLEKSENRDLELHFSDPDNQDYYIILPQSANR